MKDAKKKKVDWEKLLSAEAYAMKQETGKSVGHCFEAIAKSRGFSSYAALRAFMKAGGTK